MFILGLIASVADREKVLARDIPRDCLQCLRTTPHRLIETYRQLALFFIPVWRWNRRYALACEVCGNVESVSPQEAEAIRRSE